MTSDTNGHPIDRRTALKGLAIAGAAAVASGTLSACAQKASTNAAAGVTSPLSAEGVSWDGEYDMVVVGAGGAGLGAALTGLELGASVLTIELETNSSFSNTGLCGGVVMAADTSVQKEAGITSDSVENFKKYIEAVSGDLAYLELLNQWAERSSSDLEWLIEEGVEFPAEYLYFSGQEELFADAAEPFPRGHIAEGHIGASITKVLVDNVQAKGGEILYNEQVTSLYIDDATGAVVGVASTAGSFKANKGVVMANGGFSRNKEMLKNFIPNMMHGGSFGSTHQQGDGIRMGLEVGAKIGNMWAAQSNTTGTIFTDGVCVCMTIFSWGMPCIMVSETGERIIAEDTFYETLHPFIAGQPNHFIYIIWDQSVTDLGEDVLSVPPMSKGLEAEVGNGSVFKADSIAGLAKEMGIDSATLEATMSRFNELMESGVDTDYGRTVGLGVVNTPPFYATKMCAALCDTAGGLVVDTEYHVLDNFDQPIPGLYAAGAVSAGWRGQSYCGSGTAVGYAITSGRIAAETIMA